MCIRDRYQRRVHGQNQSGQYKQQSLTSDYLELQSDIIKSSSNELRLKIIEHYISQFSLKFYFIAMDFRKIGDDNKLSPRQLRRAEGRTFNPTNLSQMTTPIEVSCVYGCDQVEKANYGAQHLEIAYQRY
eukprot:TRINITY_DN2560_c0_g1_i1.p5 TRINITY_DN2560_c0_g1~~TRINITY_DN2560_c0_g1_i1.p5  ORF type:complete len:130 (-),score=15.86 TRINITY_DN2560_c0_g1_i1:1191-1580(-)